MALTESDAAAIINDTLLPRLEHEKKKLERIDRWYRWDHDKPHAPRQATTEYQELVGRSMTPWLRLVVTSVAQELYVEGYRQVRGTDNAAAWSIWQTNGMDGRQIAVHRAALAYGHSYVTVLPGVNDTGDLVPVMRGVSPRRMVAFYEDPAEDDWPVYALRADPTKFVDGTDGYRLRLYDDTTVYLFDTNGTIPQLRAVQTHDIGVCPVIRYCNMLDLEGRTVGEIEPFIPVAGRIDQTTFDRLVVQRFASWVVRTIAGMSAPETAATTGENAAQQKLRLKVEDILIAEDPDTKFGSLPATPLDGFIKARDADIRDLAAVTQTPPHHLLGQIANLSAEALAAAEASLSRKVAERQHAFGEAHEQALRLAALIAGDMEGARDMSAQVRWRDMESRSLAQTADALGKLATMLGVPPQALWERIPGVTEQDVQRWKSMAGADETLTALMRELAAGQTSVPALQPVAGP